MVKQWVYEKAVEMYEGEKVEFSFTDRQGKAHFDVEDEDRKYIVQVDDDLKYNCDCSFGVGKGVNGARCTHQVAVELWSVMKVGKGTFNFEVFKKDKIRDVEKDKRNQLTGQQKKVLREVLDCEMCGAESVELHRIERKGPYQLRNIMPICSNCHKKMHRNEKGHGTR